MKEKDIYINILTPFSHETFIRQLPNSLKEKGFLFFENSNLNIAWDMVVVYEGIKDAKSIKCKQGGLVFISGEPPYSRRYSTKFLNQFNHLITSHPQIKHPNNHQTQQALPWHFGLSFETKKFNYSYSDIASLPIPTKTKKISFITSNKKMMRGHTNRMKFLESLKNEFGDAIDIFGQGINPIDDKAEALLPYKFSICIENSEINDYWTEKIADPLLAFCIPIYYGCKNIDKYFDDKAILRFEIDNIKESLETIENILRNADEIYNMRLPQLITERNKILKEYNLFNVLHSFYLANINNQSEPLIKGIIKPSNEYIDHNYKMNILRMKRLFIRLIN